MYKHLWLILLLTSAGFIVMLGCSGEKPLQPNSIALEPAHGVDVAVLDNAYMPMYPEYGYTCNVARGISQATANALLAQLPKATLANAAQVIIEYSTVTDGEDYMVVVAWRSAKGYHHAECWDISVTKTPAAPLYEFIAEDEMNGMIFAGHDVEIARINGGSIEITDLAKADIDIVQFCSVVGFINDVICPVLSMVPPYGAMICAFVSLVNGIFCG